MAFPVDPQANQFIDGTTDNAASWDTKVTGKLNALRQAAMLGILGGAGSTTDVALSGAIGTQHATDATVTLTLAYSQTVLILATARFRCTVGPPAQYTCSVGYNTGSSATPGSATLLGMVQFIEIQATTGVHAQSTGPAIGWVTLAAGTWTFYGVVVRTNNGDPTDACAASQVLVLDAGGR